MMRLLRNLRWVVWPVVVPAVIFGVLFAYPGGPMVAFQDATDAGKFQEAIRADECDGERMHREIMNTQDRLQRKEELLDAWIDRRLSFRTISQNFADLNSSHPLTLQILRNMNNDVSDLELGALNVVVYLEKRCENSETPYRIKQRMQEDYQATFGHRPLKAK